MSAGPAYTLAQQLAAFACTAAGGPLPPRLLELARMLVASTIASAARGFGIEGVRAFRAVALENGGAPDATVWFDGTKLPASAAAGLNNAASDASGMDDTCLLLIGHFGGPATTAAIATWEFQARRGIAIPASRVLAAIVAGYEVGSRLDLSFTPGRMDLGFHSRVTTVQSAVVAAGLVLGLTQEQLAHAIALATSDAGGMAIGADHASDHRPYHAHQAASEGTRLAQIVQSGAVGRLDVMEAPRGYLAAFGGQAPEAITRDLGERWNLVDFMAIKLIPGAHPFHVFAEAATRVVLEHELDPDDVSKIVVSGQQLMGVQMGDWIPIRHPSNLSDAAHSVVYFVAAAIADARSGGFTWEHMDAERMADPRIGRLQDVVEVDEAPEPLSDERFVHLDGGRVTVITRSGHEFSKHVARPSGSAQVVRWPAVREKFRRLVGGAGLPEPLLEEALLQIESFDSISDPSDLTDLLRLP